MTYPEDIMQAAQNTLDLILCGDPVSEGSHEAVRQAAIETIAKAIAAERARHQWQPIETAPKDGTHILIKPVRPFNPICEAFWVDDDGGYWSDGFASCVDADVSHWMPLLPPQEATK